MPVVRSGRSDASEHNNCIRAAPEADFAAARRRWRGWGIRVDGRQGSRRSRRGLILSAELRAAEASGGLPVAGHAFIRGNAAAVHSERHLLHRLSRRRERLRHVQGDRAQVRHRVPTAAARPQRPHFRPARVPNAVPAGDLRL